MDLQKEAPGSDGTTTEAQPVVPSETAGDESSKGENSGNGTVAEEEDFETMLEAYDAKFKSLAEGAVVKGKVLKVLPNEVIVDVGYKSEGLIDIDEFTDRQGNVTVSAGDEIDVLLEKTENREGYVVLSKEKAEKMKVWDEVEKAYENNAVITGRVIERIKGGLAVDIGVRAFLPGSLVDVRPVRNLDQLRGQEFRMRVIKVNKRRGNIVLSRKAVIEEENAEKKKDTLKKLKEGAVLRGVVKNLTGYGAFIDLGGIDGLLHLTDMSWGRLNHPSERFSIGDEVDVLVLKFDPESERVSLGYKQLSKDPWERVGSKYPPGIRVSGKVVNLTDYGAFVELEEGVEGLIHVSEMSWTKKVKHPSKVVNAGDTVEAMVLDVDLQQRRLSLGLKQVEPNPWDLIADRYQVGATISGKVRNLTDFGAFVEVEEGIDGLVHISDMSWTKRIKHPSELVKKGDTIEAVILKIDSDNQRLSLGMKQLQPDVWEDFFRTHPVGTIVEGKIVRLTDFGAFVELAEGIEGLVHVSELSEERIEDPAKAFKVGQAIQAKVIRTDPAEHKIGLSIRQLSTDQAKLDVSAYVDSSRKSGNLTLGDMIGSQLAEAARAGAAAAEEEEEEAKDEDASEGENASPSSEASDDDGDR
ncbi:MAG: 30S ribosomal protein S1 [Acidobacteriota bacterium]|jgi:small subunit ribosomal protein S1